MRSLFFEDFLDFLHLSKIVLSNSNKRMAPPPVVTGLSPKEGPPGTRVTIRGEFLGSKPTDLIGMHLH